MASKKVTATKVDVCIRFGREVKRLRLAKEWTQADLSNATRLERSHISRIEAGKAEPCLRSQEAIAKALGVTLAQLFDGV
jgi:transcriptional regulator with XRE-family HTH domain